MCGVPIGILSVIRLAQGAADLRLQSGELCVWLGERGRSVPLSLLGRREDAELSFDTAAWTLSRLLARQ